MLKGGTILITAMMSITFLKRKLKGQHWGSMVLIFIGLYLVGRIEGEEEKMAQHDTLPAASSILPLELIVVIFA